MKLKIPPPLILWVLIVCLTCISPVSVYAGVNDNVAGASLELLVGEPETSDEPATLFGWFRKVWLEVSKINAIVLQVNSMSEWLGLGKEDNNPQEYGGSLVERLDYLEAEIASTKEQLTEYHNAEMTSISTIYRVSASNAYSATQIKSTVVKAVSPKQVLVQWDCSQLANCTTSNSGSGALVGWEDIQGFNIYYGSSTKIREMTLAGSVPKDDLKVFHDNYAFTVNGLEPGQLYYFWVTTVIDDVELEDSSAVRSLQLPTLASAQANGLSASPSNGTALSLSWNGNYAGYVTYNVYCSPNAFSTVEGMTPVKTGLTAKSCSVTGLTAGKTYYVAVCTVLNDESTLVGSLGSGNYKSALTGYSVTIGYATSKVVYNTSGTKVTMTNANKQYTSNLSVVGSYYKANFLVTEPGSYQVVCLLKNSYGSTSPISCTVNVNTDGLFIDVFSAMLANPSAMSWESVHSICYTGCAVKSGLYNLGTKLRDGWTIIGMSTDAYGEDSLKLWNKTSSTGYATWANSYSVKDTFYNTWNSNYGVSYAKSSGFLSKEDLESGWFASDIKNRAGSRCYWTITSGGSYGSQYCVDLNGNLYTTWASWWPSDSGPDACACNPYIIFK